jgi:hypothetical protein
MYEIRFTLQGRLECKSHVAGRGSQVCIIHFAVFIQFYGTYFYIY